MLKLLVLSDISCLTSSQFKFLSGYVTKADLVLSLGDVATGVLDLFRVDYGVHGDKDSGAVHLSVVQNLHKRIVSHNDYTLTGFQGAFLSTAVKKPSLAFSYMYTHDMSLMDIKDAPKADILISHDTHEWGTNLVSDSQGLRGISEYLQQHKPKFMIHGHHSVYGVGNFRNTTLLRVRKAAYFELIGTKVALMQNVL